MTNNEAAKWIQLYIDLAKIDPTTGEEAYLNEDDRKTLEAMEIARDALTCMDDKKMHDTDDLIRRSDALDCFHSWVDRYGDVHTPDEMAEYRAIEELPSVEQEKRTEKRTETHACDCISRREAIDLIEGLESARLKGEIDLLYPKVVKGLIGLPPAQPEIIRCKECTFACSEVWLSGNGPAEVYGYCGRTNYPILPYGFCSYAERRTDE